MLRRWLAQGGMAELYLATRADAAQHDGASGGVGRSTDVVVLKRVLPQFSRSDNFVRMFAREARLAAMLRHPNIVGVLDAGGLGAEDCFFTMEYVHGVDLGVLLDALRSRGGALPLAHALTIVLSMCRGLHYAHEACDPKGHPLGIVHRDVTPSNVLVGFDGHVKVTDFGVAKALAMTRLTEEGTRKGKLGYMSPEQATGETVDRRADVFAIATVLYELTTMERLFGGDNDLAVMYNILHRERPRPRDVSPGYPAVLEEIVLRAVSHDPDERYPTAQALQRAIEKFVLEVGLELSEEALGAFVRGTVPAPVHPRDDPELWRGSTPLRGAPQHAITVAESGTAGGGDGAPTGPIPGLGTSGLTLGSGPMARPPMASLPPGTVIAPHPMASTPAATWVAPPSKGSSLQTLSVGLSAAALLVAVVVGALVWRSGDAPSDEATPAASSPAASMPAASMPAATTPSPAVPATTAEPPAAATTSPITPVAPPSEPVAAPSVSPDPSAVSPATSPEPPVDATPAPSPAPSKRKKKKSTSPSTAPTPPPDPVASKRTAPTDTLLPIRE